MFSDVKDSFQDTNRRKSFQGINFQELLYADDTLIVAKNQKTANDYLHLIEAESEYLHLKLNQSKCCFLAYNARGSIRFKSGERMTCVQETTYLGASVSKRVDPRQEIRRRISATMVILKSWTSFGSKQIVTRNGSCWFTTQLLQANFFMGWRLWNPQNQRENCSIRFS